jgi:hypothetical protein
MEKAAQVDQEEHRHPDNPADRPLVTFDTNIVIALRNNEADAQPARQLLTLNRAGAITLNVTLSTALEEQRPGEKLEMHEYAAWLQEQGIALSNVFTGPRTIGFHVPGTPPNTTTFDVRLETALNEHIHTILFPNIPFSWVRYRDQEYERRGIVGRKREALIELESARWDIYIPPSPLAPAQRPTPALDTVEQTEREELWAICEQLYRTWMNAKNDALGFYAHLTQAAHTTHPEWAIFVTGDGNFRKRTKLAALRKLGFLGEILRPAEAVAFLYNITRIPLPDL